MSHWWEKYTEDQLIGKAVRYKQETSIVVDFRTRPARKGWPVSHRRVVKVWPPFRHGTQIVVQSLEEA